jgi:hypothetical protein
VNATTFTVFFEEPFRVGILEIRDDDGVRAARHVFGDEPSGPELYAFGLSRDYDRLLRRALAGHPVPSRRRGRGRSTRSGRPAPPRRNERPRQHQPLPSRRSRPPLRNPRPTSAAGPAPSASRRRPAGGSWREPKPNRGTAGAERCATTSRTSPRRFGTDSRQKRLGLVTDH